MIRFLLLVVVLVCVIAFAAGAISRAVAAFPAPRIASCGLKEAIRIQPSVIVSVRKAPYCVEV